MVSHLFFYQLVLVALVWLCIMLHWVWPSDSVAACLTTLESLPRHDLLSKICDKTPMSLGGHHEGGK
jgi:hypothetical protein